MEGGRLIEGRLIEVGLYFHFGEHCNNYCHYSNGCLTPYNVCDCTLRVSYAGTSVLTNLLESVDEIIIIRPLHYHTSFIVPVHNHSSLNCRFFFPYRLQA